ncbi:hypothetical protein P9112_008824 [Eukaryota sp. TZLM1-RC]
MQQLTICWISLCRTARTCNNPTLFFECAQKAFLTNPCHHDSVKFYCIALKEANMFSEAASMVEAIKHQVDQSHMTSKAWGYIGALFIRNNQHLQAYECFRNALSIDSGNVDIWLCVGFLLRLFGHVDLSEQAFVRCLSLPHAAKHEALYELGLIYRHKGEFTKALSCLSEAAIICEDKSRLAEIHFNKGFVFELAHQFPDALHCFYSALELNPQHAACLQHIGWILHSQPYPDSFNAVHMLVRAVAADYRDEQSWYLLGRVLMSHHNFLFAFQCYHQAICRDPSNSSIWCSLGVLYYYVEQYQDALAMYARAISIAPTLAEVWYDLGALFEIVGQLDDALGAYKAAMNLHPRNPQLSQRVADLTHKISHLKGMGKPTDGEQLLPSISTIKAPSTPSKIANLPSETSGFVRVGKSSDASKMSIGSSNRLLALSDAASLLASATPSEEVKSEKQESAEEPVRNVFALGPRRKSLDSGNRKRVNDSSD